MERFFIMAVAFDVLDPASLRKADNEFYGIRLGPYELVVSLTMTGAFLAVRKPGDRRELTRGVDLGHCANIYLSSYCEFDDGDDPPRLEWWVCKYDAWQTMASLARLNEEQARFVADHFAMEFDEDFEPPRNFYDTDVWPAMVDYIGQHPAKARRLGASGGSGSYIGDWYGRALAELAARKVGQV